MKKAYIKPTLIFESFEVVDSIACCKIDMTNHRDVHCCRGDNGHQPLFLHEYVCGPGTKHGIEMYKHHSYCYQNGTGENIFNS